MKKLRHICTILSIASVVVFAPALLSACGLFDAESPRVTEEVTRDLSSQAIPLTQTPAIPDVLMPVASGSHVESNDKMVIDYSNTPDGYVMVKWTGQTTMQLRVQITGPSDATYTYVILPNNTFEVFPLSDGSGSYTVNVFEQVDGDRYALAGSLTTDVSLIDEFTPFIRPNQYINFNNDSNIVFKAAQLVTGKGSLPEKIEVIYDFVIGSLTYDTEFAQAVLNGQHANYLPVLDDVIARGKGICFDFAAVMTGMLRSQGIPTRLVIGYAADVRHAWIDVFSEESGWVNNVIFFNGESWVLMDPTFAASSSAANLLSYIGDGSNYTVLFLY